MSICMPLLLSISTNYASAIVSTQEIVGGNLQLFRNNALQIKIQSTPGIRNRAQRALPLRDDADPHPTK